MILTQTGQHILKNPGIADAIVDKANIKEHEVVADMYPTPIEMLLGTDREYRSVLERVF